MTFFKRVFGKRRDNYIEDADIDLLGADESQEKTSTTLRTSEEGGRYPVIEREILPQKIICPDCGGITLEGLEFCDKCGGEL